MRDRQSSVFQHPQPITEVEALFRQARFADPVKNHRSNVLIVCWQYLLQKLERKTGFDSKQLTNCSFRLIAPSQMPENRDVNEM